MSTWIVDNDLMSGNSEWQEIKKYSDILFRCYC